MMWGSPDIINMVFGKLCVDGLEVDTRQPLSKLQGCEVPATCLNCRIVVKFKTW